VSERLRLALFEALVGTPVALRTLRARLGARGLLALLPALARAALAGDPFRALGPPADRKDGLSRRQLRQALLVDAALAARGHPAALRREVLGEVVSQVGAAFVRFNLPLPSREGWRALDAAGRRAVVERITARFFNAEGAAVEGGDAALAFDVSACHFARLLRAIGRPELTAAFCRADEVHFGDPRVPLGLVRLRTLAAGDDRCEFRFHWKADGPPGPG
jgi:hypothetical protein